jgi:hypothetical protein
MPGFFKPEVPIEKVNKIRDRILSKADRLLENPFNRTAGRVFGTLRTIYL